MTLTVTRELLYITPGTTDHSTRPLSARVEWQPSKAVIVTPDGKDHEVKPYDAAFLKEFSAQTFSLLLQRGMRLGVSRLTNGDYRLFLQGTLLGGGRLSIDDKTHPFVVNKVRAFLNRPQEICQDDIHTWYLEGGVTVTLQHREKEIEISSSGDKGALSEKLLKEVIDSLALETTEHSVKIELLLAEQKQPDMEKAELKHQLLAEQLKQEQIKTAEARQDAEYKKQKAELERQNLQADTELKKATASTNRQIGIGAVLGGGSTVALVLYQIGPAIAQGARTCVVEGLKWISTPKKPDLATKGIMLIHKSPKLFSRIARVAAPGVSLMFAAGSVGYRIYHRKEDPNWQLKAGIDVVTGVAGCFPGVGSIFSAAGSATVAVLDVKDNLARSGAEKTEKEGSV